MVDLIAGQRHASSISQRSPLYDNICCETDTGVTLTKMGCALPISPVIRSFTLVIGVSIEANDVDIVSLSAEERSLRNVCSSRSSPSIKTQNRNRRRAIDTLNLIAGQRHASRISQMSPLYHHILHTTHTA